MVVSVSKPVPLILDSNAEVGFGLHYKFYFVARQVPPGFPPPAGDGAGSWYALLAVNVTQAQPGPKASWKPWVEQLHVWQMVGAFELPRPRSLLTKGPCCHFRTRGRRYGTIEVKNGGEKHHPGGGMQPSGPEGVKHVAVDPESPGGQSNPVASLVVSRSRSEPTTPPPARCGTAKPASPPFQSHQSANVNVSEGHQPASPLENDCIRRGIQCGWDPIGRPTSGVGLFRDRIFWRGWLVGQR